MSHAGGKRGGRGRKSLVESGPRANNKKGYLPEELMSHYRRVLESLSQFKDEVSHLDHSKAEFLNNVVSGLAEELIQVSQNQTVSNIVETIISDASPANLRTLFVSATSNLSVSFLDRFASHVLEALILRLPEVFQEPCHTSDEDEEEDVSQDKVEASFKSVCEFVDAQFEVLVTHMYGSHVLRALLEALSGVAIAHELKKRQKSGYGGDAHSKKPPPQQTSQIQKLPPMFKAFFDKYTKELFRFCDYEVHLKDPLFSVLLQAVLMILKTTDPALCRSHCHTILQKVADSCPQTGNPAESVADMAQDTAGSYLLEVIFKLSDDDLRRTAFKSMLEGRLLYYAIHPAANHVLQTFIASVTDRDLMEEIFGELSKHFEDVLAVGYLGLITTLAEGCRRLRVKQDDFITVLMEAFHCKEPQERQRSLIKLIASFSAYEIFFALEEGKVKPAEGKEEPALKGPVNQHGSRLIQELLQFQKPKHAALGLLDLQPAEVQMLCCDPAGSHIVDAYFSSPTVLENNRDIFLKKLKGLLLEVACSRSGSRCLESIWRNLSAAQRASVASELMENKRLQNDHFGHFLHRSFQLGLFTTNRKKWQEQQGAATRRKRMINELLHKTIPESPVKRKKVKDQDDKEQEEDHIEDSVTALFIRHKKEEDSKIHASTQPQSSKESEDTARHTSAFSPDSQGSPKKKKRKKSKIREDPEKAKTITELEKEKIKKHSVKGKKAKGSPVKSSEFGEENALSHVTAIKMHTEETVVFAAKSKKQKKMKSVKDADRKLSENDGGRELELENMDSVKRNKDEHKGESAVKKKRKKKKKSKSGGKE